MNSKEIFMIVLLLVILAIVYKLMQSMKVQTELVGGMAVKMGVAVKKPISKKEEEEEEITEDADAEDVTNKEEESEEEEQEEEGQEEEEEEEEKEDEKIEEVDAQSEDENGNPINEPSRIKVIKIGTQVPLINPAKKKFNPKKSKLKGYELIAQLLNEPLTAKDLKRKWNEEYGETPPEKVIYNLNYAIQLNLVKKHLIGKRFLYGISEIFDGDKLKSEYLPKSQKLKEPQESQESQSQEQEEQE